jgi:hypothetical protein
MTKKKASALPDAVRRAIQELGRQGGKIGGKLRWEGVSAADRSAHAKKAVAAREAKRKAQRMKKPAR